MNINADRVRDLSNSLACFYKTIEEYDDARRTLNEELADIDRSQEIFTEDWKTQMDRSFPGWQTFMLGDAAREETL